MFVSLRLSFVKIGKKGWTSLASFVRMYIN